MMVSVKNVSCQLIFSLLMSRTVLIVCEQLLRTVSIMPGLLLCLHTVQAYLSMHMSYMAYLLKRKRRATQTHYCWLRWHVPHPHSCTSIREGPPLMCFNQLKHVNVNFPISYDKYSKSESELASALVGAPEHRKS
jgi:hypothetical protein